MPAPPVHSPAAGDALLEVRDLRAWFRTRGHGWIKAVDGVSLDLAAGESLGLVGASGCGKTTVGRAILRLLPATGGEVRFEGRSILGLGRRAMQPLRRRMQVIFQDPLGSLNPRLRIGTIVAEPLRVHGLADRAGARAHVEDLLERCGLWRGAADRYPHEFSGGQRQRIAIARALALRPRLIVCDEPTSALDVSVQSQILNLLKDLQAEFGIAYLFISHDLAVVHHMCPRIAVMDGGRIVEMGPRDAVLGRPEHPTTRILVKASGLG